MTHLLLLAASYSGHRSRHDASFLAAAAGWVAAKLQLYVVLYVVTANSVQRDVALAFFFAFSYIFFVF